MKRNQIIRVRKESNNRSKVGGRRGGSIPSLAK